MAVVKICEDKAIFQVSRDEIYSILNKHLKNAEVKINIEGLTNYILNGKDSIRYVFSYTDIPWSESIYLEKSYHPLNFMQEYFIKHYFDELEMQIK